jgi:hypothetical protein
VTHRVGMNAAIDDVDFGIRRHPESACWSTRSSKCLYRAASRPIARRLSEQFDATTLCRTARGRLWRSSALQGRALRGEAGKAIC